MHQRRQDHPFRSKKIMQANVRFPQIRQKYPNSVTVQPPIKTIKLEKINKKSNLALADLAKINRIEKEFAIMTRRHHDNQHPKQKPSKNDHAHDQMRESKLLLLKEIRKEPRKKASHQNMLSNLVLYHQPQKSAKTVNIPSANITSSPSKARKDRSKQKQRSAKGREDASPVRIAKKKQVKSLNESPPTQYTNPKELLKIDFVKMFIVEELLYYISRTKQRSKDEMSGFCKFYNDNVDDSPYLIIEKVLIRDKDFLEAVFYERLGFYIFLILGTDSALQQESSFLLNSLTDYLHTNNLIILDLLMEIIDYQNYQISSQFHVYNTSRFNQARRKLNNNNDDKIILLAKNNQHLGEIIRGILRDCGFDSLKNFVMQILSNDDAEADQKIKEVSLMLVSLDAILVSSLDRQMEEQQKAKPKPPFLPPREKPVKYTLVLDMDETLIHYVDREQTVINTGSSFLVRPYCHEFLHQLSQHYELVIFTAAVKEYADSILDILDKKGLISHRLYREHTRIEDYVSIKDISLIDRDLSKTIIIDNIQSNFKMQPRNGIAISTWVGDPEDTSLWNLIPVLKKLVTENVADLRDGLEALSKYMEARLQSGEEVQLEKVSLKGL